jgi:hypothetical protein
LPKCLCAMPTLDVGMTKRKTCLLFRCARQASMAPTLYKLILHPSSFIPHPFPLRAAHAVAAVVAEVAVAVADGDSAAVVAGWGVGLERGELFVARGGIGRHIGDDHERRFERGGFFGQGGRVAMSESVAAG